MNRTWLTTMKFKDASENFTEHWKRNVAIIIGILGITTATITCGRAAYGFFTDMEEHSLHSVAQVAELAKLYTVKYEFTGYSTPLQFFLTSGYRNVINFGLYNSSTYNIISVSTGISNTINCNYLIGYPSYEKIFSITRAIEPSNTGLQSIPVDASTLPSTGNITVNLECFGNQDGFKGKVDMVGERMKVEYKISTLSGSKLFVISLIRTEDNIFLTGFRQGVESLGVKMKASAPRISMPNPGYAVLFYNDSKYSENDVDVISLQEIIKNNFTHFTGIVLKPLNKENFRHETAYLDDCSEMKNNNGQLVCTRIYYKFDNLKDEINPFTNKMMLNTDNLKIDFVLLIPRFKK